MQILRDSFPAIQSPIGKVLLTVQLNYWGGFKSFRAAAVGAGKFPKVYLKMRNENKSLSHAVAAVQAHTTFQLTPDASWYRFPAGTRGIPAPESL